MNRLLGSGIAARIAIAALAVAVVAITIISIGIAVIGGRLFMDLMSSLGETSADAEAMFGSTVLAVLAIAAAASVLMAALLAAVVGQRIAQPLREMTRAARRIASGDLAARVERRGPDELISLADSFNAMTSSLADQERRRRELIMNAAHELRTPLTNLKGYLEGLRDGVLAADRAIFESLWEEAERLVRLSASLDDLADAGIERPSHGVRADVAQVVRATVELARPTAIARGVSFELELPPGAVAVAADPDHVAQALANLLQNAMRYTAAGGWIRVRAERAHDAVTTSVTNPGTTIPARHLPHLFERFYRADPSRDRASGGAGIGLAIVKELVENAGGDVGVSSTAGTTRFWFRLPVA
ncbi:MAG: ATP-binding protein [Chloroflexota bacterium]